MISAIRSATDFDEAFPMTETNARLNLAALEKPVSRTVNVIKFMVLAVSVAAAIPTAQNLYYSWKNGVPFNQVQYRLTQAALWEKNFDCKIDYRQLAAASGAKVEAGACQKTGDISLKISNGKGQTNYEWIAFDQLPKPSSQTAALDVMGLLISKALAADIVPANDSQSFVVAQASEAVLCQSKQKETVTRIVKENGKCFRETVSIFKGSVEARQEVSCDNACPLSN